MTQDSHNIFSLIHEKLSIPAITVVFLISIFTISHAAKASTLSDTLKYKTQTIHTQKKLTDKQLTAPARDTTLSISRYDNSIFYSGFGYDLNQHKVIKQLPVIDSLQQSKTKADSFSIKNWSQQYLPLLNRVPVKINGKSLTISIDEIEDSFFIATDQEHSRIDRYGKIIWKHATDEIVTQALITPDQQTLILRFENNVVSWYSFKNGTKLFSLFIQPETLQWILWSPQGYYDASEPDFSPITFQHNKTTNIKLSQLRYFAFKPDVVQQIIKNELLASDKVLPDINLPDDMSPPVIRLQERNGSDEDSMSFCIQSSNDHPVTVSFAINGVITHRKTTSRSDISKSSDCSYEMRYFSPPSIANYDLTVLAFDLTDNIWSNKYQHSISTGAMKVMEHPDTKIIYLNKSHAKRLRNKVLFEDYFKAGSVENFGAASNSKTNTSVNSAQNSPFVFYLSAVCEVTEDDINFMSINTSKKFLTISQLTTRLQATKIASSIILLDCYSNGITANQTALKKILHNFQFATGRNFIFQFSQTQPVKQSNMMKTLGIATAGEADFNDDLTIDSNELMKFMIKSLPEESFSENGEAGFIYSHINKRNIFEIPALLDD